MKWKNPPPSTRRGPRKWQQVCAELAEHPGCWALLRTCEKASQAGSSVGYLRTNYAHGPTCEFEFCSRGVEIYGRSKP